MRISQITTFYVICNKLLFILKKIDIFNYFRIDQILLGA